MTYSYHPLGFMSHLDSSDDKIYHSFTYDRRGFLKYALDEKYNIAITREVDPFGNIIEELFPNGLEVKKDYDAFNRLIALRINQEGEVLYTYDPLFLRQVTRTSNKGHTLYSHTYEDYDLDGNLVSEYLIGNLGEIVHATDPKGLKAYLSSPYFLQECKYDAVGNLISNIVDRTENRYSYDDLSQLSSESGSGPSCIYAHDSLYNRIQKNGKTPTFNDLNELLSLETSRCTYDLNGNQILKKTSSEAYRFTYDPLNRLIEVSSEEKKINFLYDPLGRRLSKVVYSSTAYGWKETTRENYLYHGQNEIGAFTTSEHPKNLRVFGLANHKNNPTTIGIELEGQIFAPIIDVQGNIRRLIDLNSATVIARYDFTAFGEEKTKHSEENTLNPWRFASKRFDPELGLIFFGKRYYDPEFARWLATDPAGLIDTANLYQYVFNNPFRYIDQNGEFIQYAIPLLIWGAELAIPSLAAYAGYAIAGAVTGALAYGGYKAVQILTAQPDNYSAADDYARYVMRFDAEHEEEEKKKYNSNPFDGPVSGDVVVIDEAGNAINVPKDNWLTGTKDGKWIQVRDKDGSATGERKDGGGHAREKDVRGREPHGHVPGISNPDGTPWLSIKK